MGIEVHRLAATQRRMLLEMLASERAGEHALRIGTLFGRDRIANGLCAHGMAHWLDSDQIVFTEFGRHLAELLARQIVGRQFAALMAS